MSSNKHIQQQHNLLETSAPKDCEKCKKTLPLKRCPSCEKILDEEFKKSIEAMKRPSLERQVSTGKPTYVRAPTGGKRRRSRRRGKTHRRRSRRSKTRRRKSRRRRRRTRRRRR